MRTQAHVEKVVKVYPIIGADRVEMCQILDYHVVVKKGEFSVGDLAVYVEVDSILPDGLQREDMLQLRVLKKKLQETSKMDRKPIQDEINALLAKSVYPEFEFLRSKKFEIAPMKFGNIGAYSLGILFKIEILDSIKNRDALRTTRTQEENQYWDKFVPSPGADVSELLSVKKVEDEVDDVVDENSTPKSLRRAENALMRFKVYRFLRKKIQKAFKPKFSGDWPSFLPRKSDEDNIQKIFSRIKPKLSGKRLVITEKVEGTNCSVLTKTVPFFKFWTKKKVYVCSHKVMKRRKDRSMHWRGISKLGIDKILSELPGHYFVRGELAGPGISCGAKNIYKLKEVEFFVFEVWNMDTGARLNFDETVQFCIDNKLKMVPVPNDNFYLPETVGEMVAVAHGRSAIGEGPLREGIIVRDYETYSESFKVKDPEYMDTISKNKQKAEEAKESSEKI